MQRYNSNALHSNKYLKLSDVCTLISGFNFTPSDYTEEGIYEVVTIGNVLDDRYLGSIYKKVSFIPSKSFELSIGDLLISMTGNVGRTSFVEKNNQLLNQRVCKFKFKKIGIEEFIYFISKNEKFKRKMMVLAQGGAQPNLKNKDVLNYRFKILDNKNNNLYSETYKKLDELENSLNMKLKKLQLVKSQLLNKLFI